MLTVHFVLGARTHVLININTAGSLNLSFYIIKEFFSASNYQ